MPKSCLHKSCFYNFGKVNMTLNHGFVIICHEIMFFTCLVRRPLLPTLPISKCFYLKDLIFFSRPLLSSFFISEPYSFDIIIIVWGFILSNHGFVINSSWNPNFQITFPDNSYFCFLFGNYQIMLWSYLFIYLPNYLNNMQSVSFNGFFFTCPTWIWTF